MNRYIDAQDLVDWCNETFQSQSTIAGKEYVNAFLQAVVCSPTADVVEVVRCKDCKHLKHSKSVLYGELECGHCRRYANYLPMGDTYRNGNDYCSYGERRSNND